MAEVINNINFEDGSQSINLQEDPNRKIRWNPNDIGFVDRFLEFQNWVTNDFRPRIAQKVTINPSGDSEDPFAGYERGSINAFGEELCAALDKCFGTPVSEAAFAGMNPLSPTPNGNFLFMNFINALTPVIEKSVKNFDDARKKYTNAAKVRRADHPALKK